jgi:hypothetical protein
MPWVPSDETGLKVWLETDPALWTGHPSFDAEALSWTDLSGLSNTPTGTTGDVPMYRDNIANGYPALEFSIAQSAILTFPNFASALTAGEAVALVKLSAYPPASDSTAGPFLGDSGTSGLNNHYSYSDGNIYDGFGSTVRKTVGAPTGADLTQFHVVNVGSAASNYLLKINNGAFSYSTATNTVGFGTSIKIGRNGTYALKGYLCGILFYDHILTGTVRTNAYNYFQKYVPVSVTTRSTIANGNWATAGTWNGGVKPAVGERAVVSHAVTVNNSQDFGDSPITPASKVLRVAPGGYVTVANGGTLKARGSIFLESSADGATASTLEIQGGGIVNIDDTSAAAATNYQIALSATSGNGGGAKLKASGTSGSHATLNALNSFAQIKGLTTFTAGVHLAYLDITKFGDATNPAITLGNDVGEFYLVGCTTSNCGTISKVLNDDGYTITDCVALNTLSSFVTSITGAAVSAAAARNIKRNAFDKQATLKVIDADIEDNIFLDIIGDSSPTGIAMTIANNLFRFTGFDPMWRMGDWTECYMISDGSPLVLTGASKGTYSSVITKGNTHWCTPANGTTRTYAVTDTIFESFGSSGDGDIDYGPNATNYNSHFLRVIVLPEAKSDDDSVAPYNAGTLTTNNGWTGENSIYEHVTFHNGTQGAMAMAEAGGAAYHMANLRSSIIWSDARWINVSGYNHKAYCSVRSPYGTYIAAHPGDPVANDCIQADYNTGWNMNTTDYMGGIGYDLPFTEGQGAHDIDVNPQFVDPLRCFWRWVRSIEGSTLPGNATPTRYDYEAWGLFKLFFSQRSDLVDYDVRYTLAALKTYVRAGFAPQNALLHNAGHDGVTIGAIEYASSTTPISVSDTLGVSVTDTLSVLNHLTLTESIDTACSDAVSELAHLSLADLLDASVSETIALTNHLTLADSNAVSAGEFVGQLFHVSLAESIDVSLTESLALTNRFSVAESINIALVESITSTGGGTGVLTAGVFASVNVGLSTPFVSIVATDAVGGTQPYSYQWKRKEGTGVFAPLSGQTTLTLNDLDVVIGTEYTYKLSYLDADSNTVDTNEITITLTTPNILPIINIRATMGISYLSIIGIEHTSTE